MLDGDIVGQIMAFESGELDNEEVFALFQFLLDSGMIYSLQGSYQRMATDLVLAGKIEPPSEDQNEGMKEGDLIEFWDNIVYEVTDNLNIFSPPLGKPKIDYGIFMGYQDGRDRIRILHRGKLRVFLTIGVYPRVINR